MKQPIVIHELGCWTMRQQYEKISSQLKPSVTKNGKNLKIDYIIEPCIYADNTLPNQVIQLRLHSYSLILWKVYTQVIKSYTINYRQRSYYRNLNAKY